jgi:hypothetical protein
VFCSPTCCSLEFACDERNCRSRDQVIVEYDEPREARYGYTCGRM